MILSYLKEKLAVSSQSKHLIRPSETSLILIDIQEKLTNVIPKKEELLKNITKILDAAELLKLDIHVTEQNPDKLGITLANLIEGRVIKTHSKMSFSCIECNDLIKSVESKKVKNIVLVGIESHVCILQSCIELLKKGFNVHIVSDAIKSRKEIESNVAISRMREAGAVITTTETVIFELCKTSKNKNFKKISQIIKRP